MKIGISKMELHMTIKASNLVLISFIQILLMGQTHGMMDIFKLNKLPRLILMVTDMINH